MNIADLIWNAACFIKGMKTNIHPIERIMRMVFGLMMICFAFVGPMASPWFLIGILPLLTGIVGWCPPYQLFDINTCD